MDDELAAFIRTLHPDLKKRVHAGLHEIRVEPDCGKELRDDLEGYRSLRIGRFRIIFRRGARGAIEVAAVGPRSVIYEETALLLARKKQR